MFHGDGSSSLGLQRVILFDWRPHMILPVEMLHTSAYLPDFDFMRR
jgi:hypothetical protein